MDSFPMRCEQCGPVAVEVGTAVVHHNRRDGFRLLVGLCPSCEAAVFTADDGMLELAVRRGVGTRELLPPAPPFTAEDLDQLREALSDDDWCAWLTGEGDAETGS